MTLYELIFYVCLMLFLPSIEFYEVVKLKGLVIVIIEMLREEKRW